MTAPSATILHADMDAFYAAVEQHDRPELRGLPVIVSGSSPRGVVLTASYEARVFGVHSAMPSMQARRLCPGAVFVPPRMRRYAAVAKAIRSVFHTFTPLVEPLSLDEAFLDVGGSLQLFGSALAIGQQLKADVRAATGLTVSVGIGPSRLIAKIASGLSKPDGLLEVPPEQVAAFLRPLPVTHLWGVGPATQAQLLRLGITTVGALADRDPKLLHQQLGAAGAALWTLAHGHSSANVDPDRQRKSYGEEQTFARDLRDGETLRRTITMQAEALARRLRSDGHRCRTVTLKVKLAQRLAPGKYPILTRRTTLPTAVNDSTAIADTALGLWDSIKAGQLVRLIGVSVSGIADVEALQLPLFGRRERERRAALETALDQLTSRFGHTAVARGRIPAR